MVVVVLLLLVMAAALGILGTVIKISLALLLGLFLFLAIVLLAVYFGVKHLMTQAAEQPGGSVTYKKSSTTYDVEGYVHEETVEPLPPDDASDAGK